MRKNERSGPGMGTVGPEKAVDGGTSGALTVLGVSDGELADESEATLYNVADRHKTTERETLSRRQEDFTAGPSFKIRLLAGRQGTKKGIH
jgi:hypothetical protein